jgi:putative IMPACT (imprinted ancient) family translation regulator
MSNLDAFVTSSRPPPTTVTTSQEIRDRGSAFVGNVYRATTPYEAKAAIHHHKHIVHAGKEVYEISAWRCMVLKAGRTGLGGPDDFELVTGYDDGGEQWAGSKVLKVMQIEGVIDAVVIVSRWFV